MQKPNNSLTQAFSRLKRITLQPNADEPPPAPSHDNEQDSGVVAAVVAQRQVTQYRTQLARMETLVLFLQRHFLCPGCKANYLEPVGGRLGLFRCPYCYEQWLSQYPHWQREQEGEREARETDPRTPALVRRKSDQQQQQEVTPPVMPLVEQHHPQLHQYLQTTHSETQAVPVVLPDPFRKNHP